MTSFDALILPRISAFRGENIILGPATPHGEVNHNQLCIYLEPHVRPNGRMSLSRSCAANDRGAQQNEFVLRDPRMPCSGIVL